jgi:sugar O-acyltransferase (sialic acid O-acetyltransferase NeuD family)
MKDIIIWGATGQCIVLYELLFQKANVKAIFDNNKSVKSPIPGIEIYYGMEGLKSWLDNYSPTKFITAIGGENGIDRYKISCQLKEHGFKPANAIHDMSLIAKTSSIGIGCQILIGACICAQAVIGDYTIVNTKASVDHGCKIAKGCHIGPGATLAGEVNVGEYCFIGTGAVILPKINIGNNCIIGANTVVVNDISDNSIVYGNPGKIRGKANG